LRFLKSRVSACISPHFATPQAFNIKAQGQAGEPQGGPGVALISLTLVSVTPGFDVQPLRGIERRAFKKRGLVLSTLWYCGVSNVNTVPR
jgi:hypothetical protein